MSATAKRTVSTPAAPARRRASPSELAETSIEVKAAPVTGDR
jgi:hypothetical protein